MPNFIDLVRRSFQNSSDVKKRMAEILPAQVVSAAEVMIRSLDSGGKILWCGNGGSAADAQHLSTEMVSRLRLNRPPIASLALTTDTSFLTAHSNDFGFEDIFARQVLALGNQGDVLMAISTSGNSVNIIKALEIARMKKIATIGLTGGNGGKMKDLCDLTLIVPSTDTQHIQEGHITIGHILCDLVEKALWASKATLNDKS